MEYSIKILKKKSKNSDKYNKNLVYLLKTQVKRKKFLKIRKTFKY